MPHILNREQLSCKPGMNVRESRLLVVHSATGHSGKTTICRALIRDLPFDLYIKLSRQSPHLVERSVSMGNLSPEEGDTGRLHTLQRSPGLVSLHDIIFLNGPRNETDAALTHILEQQQDGSILVEGSCSLPKQDARDLYVLRCPLPLTVKLDMRTMVKQADILLVNRFPICSPAEEQALLALLHDLNPHAARLAGSVEDPLFLETIEEVVSGLLPSLGSS